jgi:hypothetical protein
MMPVAPVMTITFPSTLNKSFIGYVFLSLNNIRNFRNSTQRYQNSAKNQTRQSDECEKYCFCNKMIVKKWLSALILFGGIEKK